MRRAARVVTVAIDAGVVELEGRRSGRRRHERFVEDAAGDAAVRDARALRTALQRSRLLTIGTRRDVRVVWETSAVGYVFGAPQGASPSTLHGPRGRARATVSGETPGATALGLVTVSVAACCPPGHVRHAPCTAATFEVLLDAGAVSDLAQALDGRRCAGRASLDLGPLVRVRSLLAMDAHAARSDLIVVDVARAATTVLRCSVGSLIAIRSARGEGREVLARLIDALLSDGPGATAATRARVHGPAASGQHAALMSEIMPSLAQRATVAT